jgi:hypothetical protein
MLRASNDLEAFAFFYTFVSSLPIEAKSLLKGGVCLVKYNGDIEEPGRAL